MAQQRDIWPENFLKGIALSVFQNSGDSSSQWTEFIKKKDYFGQRKYKEAFQRANNFWEMYENDIKLAKDLGATAFRFSFEWARFEPNGPSKDLDQAAVEKFHKILDCVASHNMEPMVTFHHFTHPQWFEEMGGFTKEENIPYFVDYATRVFQEFGPRIRLWSTFNEPTCFSFVGYLVGLWAPGEHARLMKTGEVLGNLMKAHCAAYRALKKLPGGQEARIGLVHQHIKFFPRYKLPHILWLCKWMTFWFATQTVLNFFKTGVFEWDKPFSCGAPKVLFKDEGIAAGEPIVDWWGINYYSRPVLNWDFHMTNSEAGEPVGANDFRLYPQGLYDSIKDASSLKVPIYITETGLADDKDRYRAYCVRAHYGQLLRAVNDGMDVRGCFWWTLMDNIEWHEGFHIKFGLYRWNPEWAEQYKSTGGRPPEGLKMREGGKVLMEVYNTWPDEFADLKQYAAKQVAGASATGSPVFAIPAPSSSPSAKGKSSSPGTGSKTINITVTSGSSAAVGAVISSEEVALVEAADGSGQTGQKKQK